jgi:DNA-directed RNA polymerase delta subunit
MVKKNKTSVIDITIKVLMNQKSGKGMDFKDLYLKVKNKLPEDEANSFKFSSLYNQLVEDARFIHDNNNVWKLISRLGYENLKPLIEEESEDIVIEGEEEVEQLNVEDIISGVEKIIQKEVLPSPNVSIDDIVNEESDEEDELNEDSNAEDII